MGGYYFSLMAGAPKKQSKEIVMSDKCLSPHKTFSPFAHHIMHVIFSGQRTNAMVNHPDRPQGLDSAGPEEAIVSIGTTANDLLPSKEGPGGDPSAATNAGRGDAADSTEWELTLGAPADDLRADSTIMSTSGGDSMDEEQNARAAATVEERTDTAAVHQNLSLPERQRLQREAQVAFLRSKGLHNTGTNANDTTTSGGGAGAVSPAVREGFVAHRDVAGRIANLRNAVTKKTASGVSRSGSNVRGSGDKDTTAADAENIATSTTNTNATTSTSTAIRGKDDTPSVDTAYPPYPAYPQTMVALGFRLGDPRDKMEDSGKRDLGHAMLKGARKAGVAVTGGAMVAVGAVLTPLPTPGGILLVGAGVGVLSKEFEGARKVIDKGRDSLVDLIDSIDDDKKEEKDDDGTNGDETGVAGEKNGSEDAATDSARSTTSSSIRSGLSRIGKSIRPLLTDDEAPRRAMGELKAKSERRMDEMKASTQRKYMKMRSHLNTVVDQLALPDDEALGDHDFAAASDGVVSEETGREETDINKKDESGEDDEDGEHMSSSVSVSKDETIR